MSEITWTFVNRLVDAWKKYEANFGEPPHGTQIQIAALVELAGGEASLCSLPATGAGGETPICDAQYEATARISSEVASPAAIAFLQRARQLELALKSAEAAGMERFPKELIELSERATNGPWYALGSDVMPDREGLAMAETILKCVRRGKSSEAKANANFIVALVNWFLAAAKGC